MKINFNNNFIPFLLFKTKYVCLKSWLKIISLLISLFIIIGYFLSDDMYFSKLLRREMILTPEEAFRYVIENIRPPEYGTVPDPHHSPKYLLTKRKEVFCDEGAIILATLVHKLGYPTRLVDLLDERNVSHHTVLEVRQNGKWKVYDTYFRREGVTYDECVNYPYKPQYRKYPKWYNQLLQKNFFVQKAALWARDVHE